MTVFIFTVSFRCLYPGVYQCKFVFRKLNHQILFYMLKLASPNSELSYMKYDVPTSHPFWAVSYCHCTNFCFLFFLVIACFLRIPNFRFSSPIRFCGTLGRCWMSQPCVCGFISSYRTKKKKKEIHQKKIYQFSSRPLHFSWWTFYIFSTDKCTEVKYKE